MNSLSLLGPRGRRHGTMICTCRTAVLLGLVACSRVHYAMAQQSHNDVASSLAFCITGEVRSFWRAAKSIKSHVIQTMSAGGSAHAVFAVLASGKDDDQEQILKALTLLNVSDVQLIGPGGEPIAPAIPTCEVQQTADVGPSFYQWDKLHRCYGLVKQFEQYSREGRQFDFLVRLRPDQMWTSTVKQSGTVYKHAVSFVRYTPQQSLVDYFFVVPRKYAAITSSAGEAYAHCFTAEELHAVKQCEFYGYTHALGAVHHRGTECLLHLWLRRRKVPMAQMEAFERTLSKPFRPARNEV